MNLDSATWPPGGPPRPRYSLTGQFRSHRDFRSRHLEHSRTVLVWLPPGYASSGEQRYPVFYLQDGQNVFDAATAFAGVEWQADDTAERLIRRGRLQPLILVGIYNSPARIDEYTPWRDAQERAGGKGKAYGRFLAEEVKPSIDVEYRTLPGREHTVLGGSSLGGLISLYVVSQYPDRFGRCAALSPSLWWGKERLTREFRRFPEWLRTVRFWVDMGTREGSTAPDGSNLAIASSRRLIERFDSAGLVPGRDYYYQEVCGGEHHEASWAARFDKVLLYFFGR